MSEQQLWDEVDHYIEGKLLGSDQALEEALQASVTAGLPPIAVTPAQGKLLHLLARVHRASRILEIGTLGGYSSIWLARAIAPSGRLVTLELEPRYAEVASANIERAGLSGLVTIRVGPALDSLDELIAENGDPFDLVFIDADKESTPEYFNLALQLVRPGAVIVVDNVVRDGGLADPDSKNPQVVGMRRFHELLSHQGGVTATTIQTVGAKGYDGFTLALIDSTPS
jgi:predicted O-methyltransferase YrrM